MTIMQAIGRRGHQQYVPAQGHLLDLFALLATGVGRFRLGVSVIYCS